MTITDTPDLHRLTDIMAIGPLPDPATARAGAHVASLYCERFWLPTLGPSGMWFLRWAARQTQGGKTIHIEADIAARSIGLTPRVLQRTLERIEQLGGGEFGGTHNGVDWWHLRTYLPYLTPRRLARLPEELQAEHEATVAALDEGARIDRATDEAEALELEGEEG